MSALIIIDESAVGAAPVGAARLEQAVIEPMSDHGLLLSARDGDEAAFSELVRRYRGQITNYVYRIVGDYDTAVDLAQETFLRVFRAADRYQSSYAFSTYIYKIATNLAISELRKRKRHRLVSLTNFFQSRDGGEDEGELDPADTSPLADATLVDDERRAAVARAIASLPEKYRVPLVLRDVEERSYDEIARILEMSEGTVKSRISRARSFLRDKLVQYL